VILSDFIAEKSLLIYVSPGDRQQISMSSTLMVTVSSDKRFLKASTYCRNIYEKRLGPSLKFPEVAINAGETH
jgi:hypothetical protein